MEYHQRKPVTKAKRAARRRVELARAEQKREANRQRAKTGGRENELGVTQGQNGEQGNTSNDRYTRSIGKPGG